MRLCKKCGTEKPLDQFVKRSTYCADCRRAYRQAYRANNREAAVRAKKKWEAGHPEEVREAKRRRYHTNVLKSRERQRLWRANNPDKVAARNAARREKSQKEGLYAYYRHGLTVEQVAQMESAQGGGCAICGRPFTDDKKNRNIDHDHRTGEVRGLLCNRCNPLLGWYETHLAAIHKYIETEPPKYANQPRKVRWPKDQTITDRRRTHCKNGHPLTDDNVYVRPTGERRCKTCTREYVRERWRAAHPDAPHRV